MTDVKQSPPSYGDEKVEYDVQSVNEQILVDNIERHPEESQFTWRATIVGSLLGCLVGRVNSQKDHENRKI